MPINPELFAKLAKVYDASEPVEGQKPKEVYESHKKCAPGEFGMNKEGADSWQAFNYANTGPGGLIRERTLPKSDGMGGAKSWQAANTQPKMMPVPQQQPSHAAPMSQPKMSQLPPQAAAALRSGASIANAARGNAPAQAQRYPQQMTLENVLPGKTLQPMRDAVNRATSGAISDSPEGSMWSQMLGKRSMHKSSGLDPAFIAPAAGAVLGGGIGAFTGKDNKSKLRNALLGALAGGGVGGAAEYALPGLGLGTKYTVEDLAGGLKNKVMGQPSMADKAKHIADRLGEMGDYALRRQSLLPGMELAYLPGHFKKKGADMNKEGGAPEPVMGSDTLGILKNYPSYLKYWMPQGALVGSAIGAGVGAAGGSGALRGALRGGMIGAGAGAGVPLGGGIGIGLAHDMKLEDAGVPNSVAGGVGGGVGGGLAGNALYNLLERAYDGRHKKKEESMKKESAFEFGLKLATDPATAGYAEAIPPKYTETSPNWRDYDFSNSSPNVRDIFQKTLRGTPAGDDYDRFRDSNPVGIGGPSATDIKPDRMRGDAFRPSGGYMGAIYRGAPLQYGNPPAMGRTAPPRGTGMGALRPAVKPPAAVPMAKASAFEFGQKVAEVMHGDPSMLNNGLRGAGLGAGLGGLYGLIAPGEEDVYDDNGNVIGKKQRSRIGAALRGALAGGVGGGVAGGVGGHFLQKLLALRQHAPAQGPVPNVVSQPKPFSAAPGRPKQIAPVVPDDSPALELPMQN